MDEDAIQELDRAFGELPEGVDLDPAGTIGPFFKGVVAELEGDDACPYDDPLMVDKWHDGRRSAKENLAELAPMPDDPRERKAWGRAYRMMLNFYLGVVAGLEKAEPLPNADASWRKGYEIGGRDSLREVMAGIIFESNEMQTHSLDG